MSYRKVAMTYKEIEEHATRLGHVLNASGEAPTQYTVVGLAWLCVSAARDMGLTKPRLKLMFDGMIDSLPDQPEDADVPFPIEGVHELKSEADFKEKDDQFDAELQKRNGTGFTS
jgi:hypothetical protein